MRCGWPDVRRAGALAAALALALALPVAVALTGRAATRPAPEPAGVTNGASAAAAVDDTASAGRGPRRAVRALALLHRWDGDRASAYASGDAARLRRLYAEHSGAGAADVRLLQRYAGRGLVVTGMRRQVLEAHVHRWTARRLVLQVTDRLVGAVVVGRGERRPLPSSRVTRWVMVFGRPGHRWLLAEVGVR